MAMQPKDHVVVTKKRFSHLLVLSGKIPRAIPSIFLCGVSLWCLIYILHFIQIHSGLGEFQSDCNDNHRVFEPTYKYSLILFLEDYLPELYLENCPCSGTLNWFTNCSHMLVQLDHIFHILRHKLLWNHINITEVQKTWSLQSFGFPNNGMSMHTFTGIPHKSHSTATYSRGQANAAVAFARTITQWLRGLSWWPTAELAKSN